MDFRAFQYDANGEKYSWRAWLALIVVIGGLIYAASPSKPRSPAELAAITARADEHVQQTAEDRCAGVSERLYEACVAAMKEKIDGELDDDALRQEGR